MSYYFAIVSPTDKPVFELTFGTSKAGGDGVARFRNGETSRYMNQFIVHASIDIVEEAQWLNPNMSVLIFRVRVLRMTELYRYLKHIDTYPPSNAHISCFLTGTNNRFLLLHQPTLAPSSSAGNRASTISSTSIPHNPTSPQTEEAIRQFMNEVYEIWVKTLMNPFYKVGNEIKSPTFRSRVTAAGRKWL